MLKRILDYLRYPSTWQGIITALTLVGVNVAPAQAEAIVTAGVGLVAAIATFFSDADISSKK